MCRRRHLDHSVGLHQAALDAVARWLVAREVLAIDAVDRAVVLPVGDEDLVEGDVGHRAAGRLDHRLDLVEHELGLLGGVADMDDVELLVERQGAGDIDDAVGGGARRVGREGRAGARREDSGLGHQVSPCESASGLRLACRALRNSSTEDTQPKNCSTLNSVAFWMKSGPAWCVASCSTTPKYSRKKPSRRVDSTHTLVAMPVKTSDRMPRARKRLSRFVLKKAL